MERQSQARYVVVRDDFLREEALVIKDVGPWDRFKSITNAAEEVVEELATAGQLPAGRRLVYFDSDGQLDEILVKEGRFAGFRHLSQEERERILRR